MKRYHLIITLCWATVLSGGLVTGCGRAISPYDIDLDHGLQDFKIKLSQLISDAAGKAGTTDGTFDAYRKGYSDLEIDLAMLRDRAAVLEAKDLDCSIPSAVKTVVAKFGNANAVMAATTPASPPVTTTDAVPVSAVAIGRQKRSPAVGCMTRLMDNVAAQLTAIETIHSGPEHCAAPDQPALTCLRPASAAGVLGPMNDSLDAAQLVEIFKNGGAS